MNEGSSTGTGAAFSVEDGRRAEKVGRLASAHDLTGLIEMLDDPSWAVRRSVVAALATVGPASVDPLLVVLVSRRDNETRIAATVDALAALEGDVDGAIAALARGSSPAVLADVAQILGRRHASSALPTVIALSRHADDNVAVSAIEALGRIGGRAAVDSLVDSVRSGNFFRVFPAIDVLGRSGDPRAVAPLAALLEEQPYAPEAARALGRTGEVAAVAPLVDLVGRASGAVVRLAALALAELYHRHLERFGGAVPLENALRERGRDALLARQLLRALPGADVAEQAAICQVLGMLRDPSAAAVLTTMLDGPPAVADAAATALRALQPKVEEQILRGIRDGDSLHRRALLPFVTSSAAVSVLLTCLDDADPDVRVAACEALARVGATGAVERIFALLADADPRVSYAAVAAIQALGGPETDRLAVQAARAPDVRVRRAALRILTYFGSPAALDVFLTGLNDIDERVREAAIAGLPFMDDPRAFEALIAATRVAGERTRAAAMRSLGQCSGDLRAGAHLLRGLSDPDAWVRYYACQALGKLGIEQATPAIVRLLADPAGQVRVAAVEALSCLSGEAAMAALAQAATDPDSDIQRAAIVGLGVSRRESALPLALAAARSPDPATRLVAVSALSGFRSPEVLPALELAARDEAESVRTAAIGFLAAMKGPAATRALVRLLSRAPSAEQVIAGLALHVEGRVAGLLAALESTDDETAPALTSALARMRRPDAVAALIQTMGLGNVAARKAAASALAVLATKESLAALRRAASEDPAPEVRQICILLLSR